MKQLLTPILAATLIVCGCSTSSHVATTEKPPKHIKRVKLVVFDPTPRPASAKVEFLFSQPDRKFKVIALITCEGAYHEEAVMTEAMLYKARQLGADAVLSAESNQMFEGGHTAPVIAGYGGGGSSGGGGERRLYKVNAIVFEKE